MQELFELSARNIIDKIRSKDLSITEVAEHFIARIENVNPHINAVQQFNPEKIIRCARNIEIASNKSGTFGKLHGLPITIKDSCHIKGFICSKGSKALYSKPSEYDAYVVAKLKSEGAIVFGITNTSELLLAFETDNLVYGRTNNPYDFKRTPGGSSGGQAAIIAAGASPLGIGSDAGGSIRQPAHYCGICAHKPTQGLVPLTGNFPFDGVGLGAQLLSHGPMARYVEDLILAMEIISGSDQIDPHAVPVQFKDPDKVNLKSLRIAYFTENPSHTEPTDDTVNAIQNVVRQLESDVQSVTEKFPIQLNDVYRLHFETFMLGGDGGQSLKQALSAISPTEVSPLTHQFLNLAAKCNFSITELRQRFVEIERFRYAMMRFMSNYDAIISPVTATPARLHGDSFANIHDFGYVFAHNLTGWPATVVPCGYSKDGLPIGVQIASTPWNDHVCLALAMQLQRRLGVFSVPAIEQ